MESALYGVYTLVVLYQKSHSFASLTCSISDTPQLVCKHRTHALSMKYSISTCSGTGKDFWYIFQHIDGFLTFLILMSVLETQNSTKLRQTRLSDDVMLISNSSERFTGK